MKRRIIILTLLLTGGILSCNKKDTAADLDSSWLFPIAKGEISMNSLSQLKNLDYKISIPAFSLGLPEGTPVTSPGLQLKYVGPFGVRITDWMVNHDLNQQ